VVLRQEAQVSECGGVQALAGDAAGSYGDLGLEDLIALSGDPRGVEERREARYLIFLEEPKLDGEHREDERRGHKAPELVELRPADKGHNEE
jgi:hypothetical protein